MSIELDHVFVWTNAGAPEADRLVRFGLKEGAPNTHRGQGTACRRFFFRNAYLEFLWVQDESEARSALVKPLHLYERWSGRRSGASPFGFVFRPVAPEGGALPCATEEYRPPYLPPSVWIDVACNTDALAEPMLLHLPFARRPDRYPAERQPVLSQPAGFAELSRVELKGPVPPVGSPAWNAVSAAGLLRWMRDVAWSLELGFDGEKGGGLANLQPDLPLVIRW